MGDTSGRNLTDMHLYVCGIERLPATMETAGLKTMWLLSNAQPLQVPVNYHHERGGQLGVVVVPPPLLTSWCRIEIHTNFQTKKGQSYLWVLLGACQHTTYGMRVQMVEALFCTPLQRNTVPVGIHALVGFTRLWMYKTEFIEFSYCCFLSIVALSVRRKASKQLEH